MINRNLPVLINLLDSLSGKVDDSEVVFMLERDVNCS